MSAYMSPAAALFGVWKLKSVEVTSQIPLALPQQAMSVFSEWEDGVAYTWDVVYSDGRKARAESNFRLDAQLYRITGSPVGDAWSVRALSRGVFEATLSLNGKVSGRLRAEVSADEKVLTTKWEIVQAEGPPISYTTVAERQS